MRTTHQLSGTSGNRLSQKDKRQQTNRESVLFRSSLADSEGQAQHGVFHDDLQRARQSPPPISLVGQTDPARRRALWGCALFRCPSGQVSISTRSLLRRARTVSENCAEYDLRGLPMRISAVCKSAKFIDPVTGIDLTTGAVRTTTFVENPTHATFSISQPRQGEARHGATIDTNWQSLDSDIGGDLSGIIITDRLHRRH